MHNLTFPDALHVVIVLGLHELSHKPLGRQKQ